jgi:hypothetical protein
MSKGNKIMGLRIGKFLGRWLVVSTIVLLISSALVNFTSQPALASIRQMEEAPGQILIQSRHTLRDEKGNGWQILLFQRSKADGSSIIHLRLVDFPGLADFAHPQPLKITTDTGDLFKAKDMFAEKSPAANVGEFDVQNILFQLPVTKLNLSLAMKGSSSINLSIPPEVVLEWQSVAEQN